jgi:VWFA-related protein
MLRTLVACVAMLTGVNAFQAGQRPDYRAVVISSLDAFERTGQATPLKFPDVGTLTKALSDAVPDWIAASPATEHERRSRIAALFPLEAAYSNRARLSRDDLRLIEWGCSFVRRRPPTEFEQTWMRASTALLQRIGLELQGAPHPDVRAHLNHALARFPKDGRLRLADLLMRAEVVGLSSRPGVRLDWLVRHHLERRLGGHGAPGPVQVRITIGDLTALVDDPDAGAEARAHIGLLRFHSNELDASIAELEAATHGTSDPFVRNLAWLVSGLAHEAAGQPERAQDAYRQAVEAIPTAKGAATAFATSLFLAGRRADASRTIDVAYAERRPVMDPWQHIAGDIRFAPAYMARLRTLAGQEQQIRPSVVTPAQTVLDPTEIDPLPTALPDKQPAAVADTAFRLLTTGVMVDVMVRRSRVLVRDLSAQDFELFDNGVRQQIQDLSIEPMPVDLSVQIDSFESYPTDGRSGQSVARSQEEQLKTAIPGLTALLGRDDRLRVQLVDSAASEIVPLQHEAQPPKLGEPTWARPSRQGWSYGRMSGLYDATAALLIRRTPADRRHLIVTFTDGVDDASVLTADRLRAVAQQADAILHVARRSSSQELLTMLGTRRAAEIAYQRLLWPPDSRVIETAAHLTGGIAVHTDGQSPVEQVRRILDDFRQRYILRYQPTGVDRGGWHRVTVRVKRDGDFDVTARPGYFGGN